MKRTRPEPDIRTAAEIYRATRREYEYDGTIFATDDAKVARTKWIIENKLDEPERIIIHLYCELQSIAKVARLLGIGRSTAGKEILRIKSRVIEEYNKIENNDTEEKETLGIKC